METIVVLNEFLKYPILKIKNFEISVWSVVIFLVFFYASKVISFRVSNFITNTYIKKIIQEEGRRDSIYKVIRYILFSIGVMMGLQTIGFDLSALMAGGAILALGFTFAIQNVVNNFVSGILILLESPIKKGDFIEIGKDIYGVVHNIDIRSTTVKTLDNVSVIVPNSKFVTENITNWNHKNTNIKLSILVTLPLTIDHNKVISCLLNCIKNEENILETPAPFVHLEFSGTNIIFQLNFFIIDPQLYYTQKSKATYLAIESLKREGII